MVVVVKSLSRVRLCDPVDCNLLGFSGIEPGSPALQADALTSEPPGKPFVYGKVCKKKAWSQ